MKNLEGIVIKKSVYGEADYLVTFFTGEAGKVKAIARQGKKSKKRFGGRLEPYILLRLDVTLNEGKFNTLNDVVLVKQFPAITESLESFAFGSFVLEHVDIFSFENISSNKMFKATIDVLEQINSGSGIMPSILKFQLTLLEVNGIMPDFRKINAKEVKLNISDGNVYGLSENIEGKRILKIHQDIINNQDYMDIFLAKVSENIKALTKYIEVQTEKEFKTSKFLEELQL